MTKTNTLILGGLLAGGLLAAPPNAAPKRDLVATLEFASFSDVSKKAMTLGTLVNNPMVPALIVGAGQQTLTQKYGRLRMDAPIYVLAYGTDGGAAVVYPCADGPAKTLLEHPGAKKEADGTLHLLPGASRPDDCWMAFTDDSRYCAIASDAVLAKRARDDFAAGASARARAAQAPAADAAPLLRVDVPEAGLAALAAQQDTAAKLTAPGVYNGFKNFAALSFTLDLDETGFTAEARLTPRAGVAPSPAAGYALPAGALDALPANAYLVAAFGNRFALGTRTEKDVNAERDATVKFVRDTLMKDVAKVEPAKPYLPLIKALVPALADLLRDGAPYPAARDWGASALAADNARQLYVLSKGEVEKAGVVNAAARKFLDQVAAAFDARWPGRHVLSKTAKGHVLDWNAVFEIGLTEGGVTNAAERAEALADMLKATKALLGDTKTEIVQANDGAKTSTLLARPGFAAPAPAAGNEARMAALLPEIAKERPGMMACFSLYALLRDVALPAIAKSSEAKDAQEINAVLAKLPPAEAQGGFAGAAWANKDGSWRAFGRLTAAELKSFGSAFNAFTAASMSSALDEKDDADDDDE